jgi:Xaa-Pro aminopeptidase
VIPGLPAVDVTGRIDRLRGAMRDAEADAILVTRLPNIRYLTGFTGSAGMVLVTAADGLFVTDGRYREQSAEQLGAAGCPLEVAIGLGADDQREHLRRVVARAGVQRLLLEASGVTWAQARDLADRWFPELEVVAGDPIVEGLRMVKEPAEIERIRVACHIADDALASLLPRLGSGISERAFALELEVAMRERGADGNSFDPIVASGPNGAKPHARPGDRVVERGELVVIDFGCVVDGYCSDMTRTVSVGEPSPEARHMWEVVHDAQAAGRDAVAAGVEAAAVDRVCRDIITAAGWGEAFAHGTGHGVGIEIHEDPRVSQASSATLLAGHIVTVEPGVYLPGIGGVRLEDTVAVTEGGCDPLTAFPKHLVV